MQEKPLQSSPNLHEPSVIKCLPVGMPLALLFCMSLLAATLIAPTARGFADDDDRKDTRNQRQDLRQDQQQLEYLRQQRDREIREGDKRETREYNSKIRNLEKDMRRDRKYLNKDEREEHGNKDHDHE